MNINFVNENTSDSFVHVGDIAITQNGYTLKTAGLQVCSALKVTQFESGKHITLFSHVNPAMNEDDLIKAVSDNFNTQADIRFSYVRGINYAASKQAGNEGLDTEAKIQRVAHFFGQQAHCIGQVNSGLQRVTTEIPKGQNRYMSFDSNAPIHI